MVKHNNNNRNRDLTTLIAGTIIVILVNFIGSFAFHRFDLTAENRYTISDHPQSLAYILGSYGLPTYNNHLHHNSTLQ